MTNNTSDDPNRVSRADQRLKGFVTASLVTIAFALIALIVLLAFTAPPSQELLMAMFAAVTVTVVLIFLSAARLFGVAGLLVSREGIRAAMRPEIQPVKQGINEANEKIEELFLLSMSPEMFFNLKELESGKYGHFRKGEGLDRELRYLRTIGYINIDSFDAIPEEGEDLSNWVQITDQGKRFVELRKKLEDEGKLIRNRP
jgi:hypothetical protein